MKRRSIRYPNITGNEVSVVPAQYGGTGVTTEAAALALMNAVPASTIGQPGGPARLINGKLEPSVFQQSGSTVGMPVKISGPDQLTVNTSGNYTITNYDSYTNYTLTAVSGTVSRNSEIITYTTGSTPGVAGFIINGKTVQVAVGASAVAQASIVSPVSGSIDLNQDVTFVSNAFSSLGVSDTHEGTDWQVSIDANFSTLFSSITNSSANKTSYSVSGLSFGQTYYARVRHKGLTLGYGAWSSAVSFTIKSAPLTTTEGTFSVNGGGPNQIFGENVLISTDGKYTFITKINSSNNAIREIQVFVKSGSAWVYQTTLTDSVPNSGFGSISVTCSTDGSTLAVGSYMDSSNKGAVHIYTRTGSTWSYQTKIVPADAVASNISGGGSHQGDYFGMSIDLSSDGNTLISSSPNHNSYNGAIYVYSRAGSTWSQTTKQVSTLGNCTELGYTLSVNSTGTKFVAWGRNTATNAPFFETFVLNSTWSSVGRTYSSGSANLPYTVLSGALQLSGDGNTLGVFTTAASGTPYAYQIYIATGNSWLFFGNLEVGGGFPGGGANLSKFASMSSSADYVAVGMAGENQNQGAVYVFAKNGATYRLAEKIVSPNTVAGDGFGNAVCLTGNGTTLVVGARSKNSLAGAVYYYNSSWIDSLPNAEETVLLESAVTDSFGKSIVLSADGLNLFVGSPTYNSSYGKVDIYKKASGNWVLDTTIAGTGGTNNYQYTGQGFGTSLDVSDDGLNLVVGTNASVGGSSSINQPSVYKKISGNWVFQSRLHTTNNPPYRYGSSVRISGDGSTIVVGSDGADSENPAYGKIIVFYNNGSAWVEQGMLQNTTTNHVGSGYGHVFDISDDGSTICVGQDSNVNGYPECFYVYTRSGSTWNQYVRILPSLGTINQYGDWFGWAIKISGDGNLIFVSAPSSDANEGSVHVFRKLGIAWNPVAKISNPVPDTSVNYAQFGRSISVSKDGSVLSVGKYGTPGYRGQVHVFKNNGSDVWVDQGTLLYSGAMDNMFFGSGWGYGTSSISLSSTGSVCAVSTDASSTLQDRVHIFS